jgi:hypothetical protein
MKLTDRFASDFKLEDGISRLPHRAQIRNAEFGDAGVRCAVVLAADPCSSARKRRKPFRS